MLAEALIQEKLMKAPFHLPAGEICAFDVTAEIYMRDYAEYFYEWVEGILIKMSPVTGKHDELTTYLRELLRSYFVFQPLGLVRSAPFVMRLEKSRREPDLQVILKTNRGTLTDTYMDGAADICVEVVSASNANVDYGDKFLEYEAGGVQEYWLIDPLRQEALFYRLNEQGRYKLMQTEKGVYSTPLLPQLQIPIAQLWEDEMPNIQEVLTWVKKLLA